eukprot:COSAG01_NODE_13568_length_1566_cov_10.168769_2_plen_463_part_01
MSNSKAASITALKNNLFTSLESYLNSSEITMISRAFDLSNTAHATQKRASGAAYISHPLEVALILAKLEQDAQSIAAALLHDTLEDCDIQLDDLRESMGPEISNMVDGVTKLTSFKFASKAEEQAENFRKMILAMSKDFRVIIIKLADRLHNMRTLHYLSAKRQEKIASETLHIFAPLAHRLGMASLKWELEDLAFQVLMPAAYTQLKADVAIKRQARESYVNTLVDFLKEKFKTLSFMPEIYGRPKHLYSIYQKMQAQSLSFHDLYDIYGLRILTADKGQCYECLGLLHTLFKPIEGRFKDYIALPKSNCYQSLHSIVIGPSGQRVEFQIRTKSMHEVAEMGVASHWRYKEGKSIERIRKDFSWLRQLETLEEESQSARDLLDALQDDLFPEEVFVFSPKGDVYALKKGATALDFAYLIHSEVGHRCKGIKINHAIKPLNTALKQGDQVEVLCSKADQTKKA